MIHWTGHQARTTGSEAADAIIRQARMIEARDPRPAPFTAARMSRVAESVPAKNPIEPELQAAGVPEPRPTPA
jgi:hypothetical protein